MFISLSSSYFIFCLHLSSLSRLSSLSPLSSLLSIHLLLFSINTRVNLSFSVYIVLLLLSTCVNQSFSFFLFTSVTRCLDYLFNICPLTTLHFCPKAFQKCQSRLDILQNIKLTIMKGPKTFEIVQRWRNFGTSGHTAVHVFRLSRDAANQQSAICRDQRAAKRKTKRD